ncbi:hypothetical protein Tco_0688724 [Tanacetum coccineum]
MICRTTKSSAADANNSWSTGTSLHDPSGHVMSRVISSFRSCETGLVSVYKNIIDYMGHRGSWLSRRDISNRNSLHTSHQGLGVVGSGLGNNGWWSRMGVVEDRWLVPLPQRLISLWDALALEYTLVHDPPVCGRRFNVELQLDTTYRDQICLHA